MRYCQISKLSVGDNVAKPILSPRGEVMLSANAKVSEFAIKKLASQGINGIYIYDELSEDIDVHSNLPMDLQLQLYRDFSIDSCTFLANELVDNLQNVDGIITDLSALAEHDSYTYTHSVNVATYCGILGLHMDMGTDKIKNLVSAALLHDIGKSQIPDEIINKKGKLTDEEKEIMEKHPQYGYDMLRDCADVPSVVKASVLEHHENWDGSGYPRHLKGEDIYLFARIIHVCDVYDAMISKRSYKECMLPSEVLEYLTANCYKMFDPEVVKEFMQCIVVYPNGSLVHLSDQTEAVVVSNTEKFPLRPVVRDFNNNVIDLMENNNIVITDYAM